VEIIRGPNTISYTNKKAYGEGVYLNGIYYSFFSDFQYENDLILRQFVDQTMKVNYSNFLRPMVSFDEEGSSINKPYELFGLLIKNNHFIFMTGSMYKVPDEYQELYIGTTKGEIKEIDLKKISANILIYIDGMNNWKGGILWEYSNRGYCKTNTEGCRNGIYFGDVTPIVKFK
jgi:hypothetical protein